MMRLCISLACHGQLVKMLITLESHAIFSLNFASLYILRLSLVYIIKLNNYIKNRNIVALNNLIFHKSQETIKPNLQNNINFYMGRQNWPCYKQINNSLSDGQSAIGLQNVVWFYFGLFSKIAQTRLVI